MTGDAEQLLTDAEMTILDYLKEATVRFMQLPEHHISDKQEWAVEVHALQQRIMCRAAIRAYPGLFTPMMGSLR